MFIKTRLRRLIVTTDADGAFTGYLDLSGRIDKIFLDVGTLATTVDFTITDNETGETILSKSNVTADAVFYVRVLVQDTNGANIANTYDISAVKTIKVVVAQGGNTKTGDVYFYMG